VKRFTAPVRGNIWRRPNASSGWRFNDTKREPFKAQDIRFTTKGETLYALPLAWPTESIRITSLAQGSEHAPQEIASVKLLGSDEEIKWQRDGEALTIEAPQNKVCDHACAFAISFA
jgi:alpha-L-fucosidase